MLKCEYRRKPIWDNEYCTRDHNDCSPLRWALCKGLIIWILLAFGLAYFAYGVVWAWQGAEDRRQGLVTGDQWSVAMQKAERKELVVAILECESSSRPQVWGDGGKSYGIAQVQKRTWDYLAPKAGIKGDWKDPENQVALLDWAIQNGYGDNWTCFRKLRGM